MLNPHFPDDVIVQRSRHCTEKGRRETKCTVSVHSFGDHEVVVPLTVVSAASPPPGYRTTRTTRTRLGLDQCCTVLYSTPSRLPPPREH